MTAGLPPTAAGVRARWRRTVERLPLQLGVLFAVLGALFEHAGPARGDEPTVDVGLTLNPIIGGIHESFNDQTHVPPVPIPLLELRAQSGPFELDLEGLPPVASVRSYDARQGHTSTILSVFEGVARIWDPLHRFSAGIGQTLYNQTTHYRDPVEIAGTGETQFSRVTGVSYQLGYGAPFRRGRFEAVFNYAPVMLGTQFTLYDVGTYRGRADPERAKQIDTAIRYVRPVGTRGEFILSLRYINYTASYAVPDGGLSDRNVGLLPGLGYLIRLGP